MPDAARSHAPAGLTDRQVDILAFERNWFRMGGMKEEAIRARFDVSASRYYQMLNELIDSPAALAHDPLLVKRLRRLRETRQRQRSAKRLGFSVNN